MNCLFEKPVCKTVIFGQGRKRQNNKNANKDKKKKPSIRITYWQKYIPDIQRKYDIGQYVQSQSANDITCDKKTKFFSTYLAPENKNKDLAKSLLNRAE